MGIRILHVVESLQPHAGSVAVPLLGLMHALHDRGITSDVMTMSPEDRGAGNFNHVLFTPESVGETTRRAEVVHIHSWGAPLSARLAASARDARTPFLITPLGRLVEGPFSKLGWKDKLRRIWSENKLIRGAAVITAVNTAERRGLVAGGFAESKVRVLDHGLPVGEYAQGEETSRSNPDQNGGKCLLCLGPITPVEGLGPLMKAMAQIGPEAADWRLVIAGRGEGQWRRMIEAAVGRKVGPDRVQFTDADDLPAQRALLAKADAVAVPSTHFRCPTTVLQAMASGVPVLATTPVAPDDVEGAVITCPPTQGGLVDGLRTLLKQPEQDRRAQIDAAHKLTVNRFDWGVLSEEYRSMYESLC